MSCGISPESLQGYYGTYYLPLGYFYGHLRLFMVRMGFKQESHSFSNAQSYRFLYKGREVSYTSVLSQSVSTRRASLYQAWGFDMERWAELISEQRRLRAEMNRIAEDYDVRWDGSWKINGNSNGAAGALGEGIANPDSVGVTKTHEETLKDSEKELIKEKAVKPDIIPRQEAGVGKSEEGAGGEKRRLEELERVDRATDGRDETRAA